MKIAAAVVALTHAVSREKYRETNSDKPLDNTSFNIESETEFPKLG